MVLGRPDSLSIRTTSRRPGIWLGRLWTTFSSVWGSLLSLSERNLIECADSTLHLTGGHLAVLAVNTKYLVPQGDALILPSKHGRRVRAHIRVVSGFNKLSMLTFYMSSNRRGSQDSQPLGGRGDDNRLMLLAGSHLSDKKGLDVCISPRVSKMEKAK